MIGTASKLALGEQVQRDAQAIVEDFGGKALDVARRRAIEAMARGEEAQAAHALAISLIVFALSHGLRGSVRGRSARPGHVGAPALG